MSDQIALKQQRDVFDNNRSFIVEHLNPDDIIADLIQAQTLIGENAAQKVRLPVTTKGEKNRIIVDELRAAGPGTLRKFCEILKSKEKLKFIAEKLEKCE